MGLGLSGVKLYLELWQGGFFRNINSVMDMGSQELQLTPVDFEELVHAACVPNYKKENFVLLTNWPGGPRCSTKPFYEMLDVERYSCIDLGGQHDAIRHDLNFPFEDSSLYEQYDLVTDYGNNEHIFNTAEAYRTMHRLCKPQGFVVIMQVVYRGNGYYAYDPSFFEGIAAANNYKITFSSYLIASKRPTRTGTQNDFHVPLSDELLDVLDWSKVESIGICYVMQKQSKSDFRYPYQGRFLSKVQEHCGYRLQFLSSPPSRTYIPVLTLTAIPAKSLLQALFWKGIRKIKVRLKLQ